jgi:hypothetical protein
MALVLQLRIGYPRNVTQNAKLWGVANDTGRLLNPPSAEHLLLSQVTDVVVSPQILIIYFQ